MQDNLRSGTAPFTVRNAVRVLAAVLIIIACASSQSQNKEGALATTAESENHVAAFLTMDDSTVYLQVFAGLSGGADLLSQGEVDHEKAHGWTEIWQEGNYLLSNTTTTEVTFRLPGLDTYIWASVYDSMARYVCSTFACILVRTTRIRP